MNRKQYIAGLTAFLCAPLVSITALPARAGADPSFEITARSIVKLNSLSRQLAAGIAQQVAERGVVSDDSREEITVAAADSLARATACLKRRFFDGADPDEVEERICEINDLVLRVQASGSRLGLYGYLREKLAAFLNERDWLVRHLGLDRPQHASLRSGNA